MMVSSMWLLCLVILLPISAYAQIHLYVPDIMMQNTSYEGLVLSEKIQNDPYVVNIIGGTAADTQDTVFIPAGSNHAIFSIYPKKLGNHTVSAILPDAEPLSASYAVYPDTGQMRLNIVTPQGDHIHTTTPHVPLFLFLTDHTGKPVTYPKDITVSVSAPPSVSVSDEITIQSGTSHVYVPANIQGSGTVYASAPGISGDTSTIRMIPPNVSVHVGVAPNPAPPGMPLSYVVWLQSDNTIYEPDIPLEIFVTSSDPAVAGARPAAMPGSIHRDIMYDTIHQGVLYAGSGVDDHRGNGRVATITVSIPGVGVGSETVRIGPDTDQIDDLIQVLQRCITSDQGSVWSGQCRDGIEAFAAMGGRISGGYGEDPRTLYLGDGSDIFPGLGSAFRIGKSDKAPDTVRLWAFPDVPSDTYVVSAGFYYTAGGMIPGIPVKPAELSRMGFTHGFADIDVNTTTDIIHTRTGLNLTVFGDHITGDTIHLQGPSVPSYDIRLQAAPIAGYISQENHHHALLAMLYTVDAHGHITHLYPDIRLASYGNLTITDTDVIGDAMAIYGTIHDATGGLQAHIPGHRHHTLPIYPQDDTADIRLWAPDMVHISEEFPIAVHSMDDTGTPTGRIYDVSFVSDTISAASGQRMISDGSDGGMAAIWQSHADYRSLESFANIIDGISVIPGPIRVNLGDHIILSVYGSAPYATTEILGTIDMHPAQNGTFVGWPQTPGNYDVTVHVSGDGWEDYTDVVSYVVDHFVSVSYQVSSDDDIPLPFQISMMPSVDDTTHDIIPGTETLITPDVYTISMPYDTTLGANSYRLSGVQINEQDYEPAGLITISIENDTAISVSYDRMVYIDAMPDNIEAPDVSGAGTYRLHQEVHLYAPIYHSWAGLLWHYPVIWEGITSEYRMSDDMTQVWLVADRDIDAKVIYDTSYVIPLVIITISAASPAVLFRDQIAKLWMYRNR